MEVPSSKGSTTLGCCVADACRRNVVATSSKLHEFDTSNTLVPVTETNESRFNLQRVKACSRQLPCFLRRKAPAAKLRLTGQLEESVLGISTCPHFWPAGLEPRDGTPLRAASFVLGPWTCESDSQLFGTGRIPGVYFPRSFSKEMTTKGRGCILGQESEGPMVQALPFWKTPFVWGKPQLLLHVSLLGWVPWALLEPWHSGIEALREESDTLKRNFTRKNGWFKGSPQKHDMSGVSKPFFVPRFFSSPVFVGPLEGSGDKGSRG